MRTAFRGVLRRMLVFLAVACLLLAPTSKALADAPYMEKTAYKHETMDLGVDWNPCKQIWVNVTVITNTFWHTIIYADGRMHVDFIYNGDVVEVPIDPTLAAYTMTGHFVVHGVISSDSKRQGVAREVQNFDGAYVDGTPVQWHALLTIVVDENGNPIPTYRTLDCIK